MKKSYSKPAIKSEKIKIGVFGTYGKGCDIPSIGGSDHSPHNTFGWWPFIFGFKAKRR